MFLPDACPVGLDVVRAYYHSFEEAFALQKRRIMNAEGEEADGAKPTEPGRRRQLPTRMLMRKEAAAANKDVDAQGGGSCQQGC